MGCARVQQLPELTAARNVPVARPSGLNAQSWGLCSLIGPRNRNPGVYGTDLGFTAHRRDDRALTMLFGDTWLRARNGCRFASPVSDDFQALLPRQRPALFLPGAPQHSAAASCDLLDYPFERADDASSWPRVRLFPSPAEHSDGAVMDTSMLRTPAAVFSDAQHLFAIFSRGDPAYCARDAECPADMQCSAQPRAQGQIKLGTCTNALQLAPDSPPSYCRDAADCGAGSRCEPAAHGVCMATRPFRLHTNEGTVVPSWYHDDPRRGIARTLYIAAALWPERPSDYAVLARYSTNRFQNVAVRSVAYFDAEHPERNDYRPGYHTLLVWGRTSFAEFAGAQALPFLFYIPLAEVLANPEVARWQPRYFAGYGDHAEPTWSQRESDAQPIYGTEARILQADGEKIAWREPEFDYVEWSGVSFVAPLKRWLMLYGGDLPTLFVLDPHTGKPRAPVHLQFAAGAIHMRSAPHPWGELRAGSEQGWSSPEPILTRQNVAPYLGCGPHGDEIMPGCVQSGEEDTPLAPLSAAAGARPGELADKCPVGELDRQMQDAASGALGGRLYAPNIIDDWTQDVTPRARAERGPHSAEIYWNVSTWSPYQVILVKSRIEER
jgi:hypothetical protein